MISYYSLLTLGLLLGIRHAVDADHVLAVSTIVSRERNVAGSAAIGLAWGVGHTLTIVLVGGGILFLGVKISATLNLALELAVAATLILLGIWALRGAVKRDTPRSRGQGVAHSHVHAHGDYAHRHAHEHGAEDHGHRAGDTPLARLDSRLDRYRPYRLVRPLVVGMVHGLAGSAAVTFMILAAIKDPFWAFTYLTVFGAGTVFGMMLVTAVVAMPFALSGARFPRCGRGLQAVLAVLSVALGTYMIFQVGLMDGLFAYASQPVSAWLLRFG